MNWAEQRRLQTSVKLRLKTFHCNEDVGDGSSDDAGNDSNDIDDGSSYDVGNDSNDIDDGSSDDVGNDSYDTNDQVLELEQRKDANLTELEALRHQVNCIIINLTLNVNTDRV